MKHIELWKLKENCLEKKKTNFVTTMSLTLVQYKLDNICRQQKPTVYRLSTFLMTNTNPNFISINRFNLTKAQNSNLFLHKFYSGIQ